MKNSFNTTYYQRKGGMKAKNSICKKTLSGKHVFEEETRLSGSCGYMKITKNGWIGGLTHEWQPSSLKRIRTGRFYCTECGIFNDIKDQND